jgi:hypothetical protein
MDLSFLLFVFFVFFCFFFVLGEEGWGRQVSFTFLLCSSFLFPFLGFLMPYKAIGRGGGGGEDLAMHGDYGLWMEISPWMDGKKLA